MRRSISFVLAAAVAASSVVTSAPVLAAMPSAPRSADAATDRNVIQVEQDWGRQLRRQNMWRYRHGGNGWNQGGRGWDNDWRGQSRWHGHGHHGGWDNDGAGIALGLFGFAAGAALGSQLYGGGGYAGGGYAGGGQCGPYDSHDRACDNRFRSYDWCSNTYMGYDGYRHYC